MQLFNNLKPFKIYQCQTYLPYLESDKKKGSSITLLSPNYEASKFLMNHPLFVNNKRFESYYIDRDVSFLIGNKKIEEVDEAYIVNEGKRSDLPDSSFGIPEDRKFPLDTEKHVRSAIRLFGHAEESKKKSLAKKIANKAKEYNIEIPETTQVYKYLHENCNTTEDKGYIATRGDFTEYINEQTINAGIIKQGTKIYRISNVKNSIISDKPNYFVIFDQDRDFYKGTWRKAYMNSNNSKYSNLYESEYIVKKDLKLVPKKVRMEIALALMNQYKDLLKEIS